MHDALQLVGAHSAAGGHALLWGRSDSSAHRAAPRATKRLSTSSEKALSTSACTAAGEPPFTACGAGRDVSSAPRPRNRRAQRAVRFSSCEMRRRPFSSRPVGSQASSQKCGQAGAPTVTPSSSASASGPSVSRTSSRKRGWRRRCRMRSGIASYTCRGAVARAPSAGVSSHDATQFCCISDNSASRTAAEGSATARTSSASVWRPPRSSESAGDGVRAASKGTAQQVRTGHAGGEGS